MNRPIARFFDSKLFAALTFAGLASACAVSIPMAFSRESPRETPSTAAIKEIQAVTPVEERQSVIVYGDSRGAFLGDGLHLVPGWSPVVNDAREGCAFLAQDRIFRQYVEGEAPMERSSSEQIEGGVKTCDTRTYLPSVERYDLAIVYAGTLLTVNNGTTIDNGRSPVDGFMDPANTGMWSYLVDNFSQSLSMINAVKIVVVSTPISTFGAQYGNPFWDDPDRLMAVNAMLSAASVRSGATYLPTFGQWVESLPPSCQPDGSHLTMECARQAGLWIKASLEAQG